MKLYERLGLDRNKQLVIDWRLEGVEKLRRGYRAPEMVAVSKGMDVMDADALAFAYFADEDSPKARQWGQETVNLCRDFFFGQWRKDGYQANKKTFLDEQRIRREDLWIDQYRTALFWALVLRDERSLLDFAGYAGDDCYDESHLDDFAKSDRAWYIMLARFVRGEGRAALKPYAELIESDRKKKPKLLLAALLAIVTENGPAFNQALAAYLKYFKAHEFPEPCLQDKFAIDGTILVHLAARAGLAFEIPSAYQDHIVRFGEPRA